MKLDDLARATFRNELWRSVPSGVLDTVGTTFGVLIAVRVFHMGEMAKATLLASASSGLMLSLFMIPVLMRWRTTVPKMAARVQWVAASGFLMAAVFAENAWAFGGGVCLGLFGMALQIPLLTHVYESNYPGKVRGTLFSIAGMLRAAVSMIFGLWAGYQLELRLEDYRYLLLAFSVAGAWSGWLTYSLPAPAYVAEERASRSLWSSLRWIQLDATFRTLLISWMIMGIGNLVCVSLFVEYLANPAHGINLPEREIAWVVGVVPVTFRLLFGYPWGLVYDRCHLFTVRAILNLFFAASALLFFTGQCMAAWVGGMALFGIANAGGNVTWSLWVTKLAPPGATAEYMSVHTFFTGLRGLVSPFLAFALLAHFNFVQIAWGAALSMVGASIFITARRPDGSKDERL